MEDTLFAGALVGLLADSHDLACGTARLALEHYQSVKDNLLGAIRNSSHAKRLEKLNVIKDTEFCVAQNTYGIVPVLKEKKLVLVN